MSIRVFAFAMLMFAIGVTPAVLFAQDNTQQLARAVPALIDQRNNALNQLALCDGNSRQMQDEIDKLRKELAAIKEPKP